MSPKIREIPECEDGFTDRQVRDITGDRYDEFCRWMYGQTMSLCEGRKYDHARRTYYESCGGVAHGGIVYKWDLQRFLDGRPIID